ncbi:hypothetical protein FBQ97_07930 [Acidobacteria bacterium ACD]|nr:MAG: hypothetical protein EDX89_01515 [Acidobacteriota bacterium]MCE7958840.1 hypothetical protein [Acidobacteria bacterium ACB2]MDL1949724.1 hypothetical protein [Acidobacteria bacterium ACD]
MTMADTPFRTLFLLRNKLENIQVVPLGSTHEHGSLVLGGTLAGRAELVAFVTEIGFDSLVESFQVSDLPHPSFLRTYHLAPSPEAIVRLLDQRLVAEPRYAHKVLELAAEKSPEQLTLSPHEAFQLGATTLDAAEGILRVHRWFEDRSRPRGD